MDPLLIAGIRVPAQSHLLVLPLEVRELILHHLYGSIVISLWNQRALCPEIGTWTNIVQFQNPCPSLLLVSRQLRNEALHAILRSCVLDVWGHALFRASLLRGILQLTSQIRFLATPLTHFYSILPFIHSFRSLETI